MNENPRKIPHDQLARAKMLEDMQKQSAENDFSDESVALFIDLLAVDNIEQLIQKVIRWHHDRNLINGSSDKDQVLKLSQELGELSDSVCKGGDIKDDIGDMLVVMLNITERNEVSLADCLQKAYNDIKDRKGKMVDGIFIKEEDLNSQ